MSFPEKLARILELEQLNLREFSDLAGIHYQTASQYKTGRRSPTFNQLQKMLAVPRFEK